MANYTLNGREMQSAVWEQDGNYYISAGSRGKGDYIRHDFTNEEREAYESFAATEKYSDELREEDNEFKSTITASERVEGLTFEMWNDGSGIAWLNGERLGSIDLATKEIEIGKRDFILSDNTADEIKSEFREKIEKLAIEKGAKKISADAEEEAVSGNKKDADSVSRKQPLNEKQQNEEVQKPAPVCARRHRGR